jgi:Fe-S oxidoreductase
VVLLEQFLENEFAAGNLERVQLSATTRQLLIHLHCHQKALYGDDALRRLLSRIDNLNWSMIEAGCCGMAGSFGYEHYELSRQIGEDRLFPAIRGRAPHADVAATGTSCRQQIRDFLAVDARHWCQFVNARVDVGKGR